MLCRYLVKSDFSNVDYCIRVHWTLDNSLYTRYQKLMAMYKLVTLWPVY